MENKIRTLREERHISPKDLASRLGIDPSTLNRIENSKVGSFRPELLCQIADEFGVTIDKLFGHEASLAIQHNEEGQNINVLHQTNKSEDLKELYEQLVKTQQDTIESLKRELKRLSGE